tara:strand:- start:1850 stop:2107 length:258 start_codon:yes stop_codon:yes gene_type:complete
MSSLQLKITSKTTEGKESFQGTVTIPGLKPTKLARKSDGCSCFSSSSAVRTSARSLAKSLGFDGVDVAAPTKKAAKKPVKKRTKK